MQQRVSRKRLGSNNWLKAQKKVARLHEYVANSRKDFHRKLSHQLCDNEPLAVDGFPGISKVANPKGAGMIFVEDLNLVGLSRGMLGKHCLDKPVRCAGSPRCSNWRAGFGQFFNILEQTCFKRGVYFQKVDARKTSQICPNCQHETGHEFRHEKMGQASNNTNSFEHPTNQSTKPAPFFKEYVRKKILAERVHNCDNCGYQTDRDVAAAQVVLIRGLAAVGHTVKMREFG